MGKVLLPSDRVAIAAVISPAAKSASTYTSSWVSMATFSRIMAVIAWGAIGNGGEIDAKLEQATDSGGTGAKDITGKAITQVSEDVTPQPTDKQALINVEASELDVTNGFDHVRLSITNGATTDLVGMILGLDPRYGPASDNDASSVAEIVY